MMMVSATPLTSAQRQEIADSLNRDGFAIVRKAVDPSYCASVGREVIDEYRRLVSLGWKFAGGGRLAGHLAIDLGPHGPCMLSALRAGGYVAAAEQDTGMPLSVVACVGNLNLPGSVRQEFHQDPKPLDDFIVINVFLVESQNGSGAIELGPGTQGCRFTYDTLFASGEANRTVSVTGSPGDVLIRRGSTWHRGTANRSGIPRPMYGVILRPTVPPHPDPSYDGEPIGFRANRFYGRSALIREVLEVYGAPLLHAVRRIRSRQ